MRKQLLYIIFFLSCLYACQEEDSFIKNIEEIIQNNDELVWREEQNSWIFTTMNEHYFWNDQLKDSSFYDYYNVPLCLDRG